MSMQAGIGVSRILVLAGAGYTGTIMLKNGKLSELLGELQSLVKGMGKPGEQSDGDSDYSDAIAQQVRRLAMEVRQLASARQITVLNGNSGQMGNLSGLIVPAATLGALGYGYMWWKGLKFSDLMYVTKRSMASAVSNLTKHLEQVSEALSTAKTHLTQRIQHLDDKMESQKEISKAIQNDVNVASENLALIGSELWQLQCLVSGLDGKIGSLEEKQDIANMGVMYLCNFVGGKKAKMPKALEDQLKPSGRKRASLTYSEVQSLTGLKELADNFSQTLSEPATDATLQDGTDNLEDQPRTPQNDQPRTLLRTVVLQKLLESVLSVKYLNSSGVTAA
ncbi:hypothetical protein OIU85_024657 [Salix viminalis]|uniref:DUF1664 domain-containing protein n=1 Tax=Salix viminalis TaxID=40686 RepID=A0A9Q0Z511_SALVM|nr:hypothetical protein OIU85_024657 [Salix viminalis]